MEWSCGGGASISRNYAPPAGALSLTVGMNFMGCQACFNFAAVSLGLSQLLDRASGLISQFVGVEIVSDNIAVLMAVGIVFIVLSLTQIHIWGAS